MSMLWVRINYYILYVGQVKQNGEVLATLISHATGQVIKGVDSNVPLDQVLDRPNPH